MQKQLFFKIIFFAIFIILLNNSLNWSMLYGEEKNVGVNLKSNISKIDRLEKDLEKSNIDLYRNSIDASRQSIDTANSLIKYIGVVATIFGIIIALAGIFIAIEGIRSRQRREEAITSLEEAKKYVEKKLNEFDETIKIKLLEIDKLIDESKRLALDQLTRDTEEASKSIQEARDQLDRDTKLASQAINERKEKGIKTEAELKIEQLERRIKFFEEIGIPDEPKLLFSKAAVLEDKGMLQESLELLKKIIAIDSKNISAYFRIGWVEDLLGHYPEAIAAYDQYIALDPRSSAAYNNKGVALSKLGKDHYNEALECYKKALEIKPDNKLYKENINNISKKIDK
jgi:tetratricopeptide (TPR) repeat protein